MNSMTPFEDEVLARALRGQVDGLAEAPFTVDDIAGRAGRIQRNRRATAAAGVAAAVAAIALPATLMSGGVLDRSDAPPVATQAPSPAPSVAAGDLRLDLADLPRGAAPRLGYATLDYGRDGQASGGILHAPDGSTMDLPSLQLNAVVHQGDAWVASMFDPDAENQQVFVLEAPGGNRRAAQLIGAEGSLAANADGSLAGWVGPDDGVLVRREGAGATDEVGRVPGVTRVVAVVGDTCDQTRGCAIVLAAGDESSATVLWAGGEAEQLPGPFTPTTASLTRIGGVVSFDEREPGSCSELRDLGSGETLWETCDHQLGPISPDGSQLIGLPSYADGFGTASVPILDAATGDLLRSWDLRTSTDTLAGITQLRWEDTSHVLLEVYADGAWSVVRVSMDGTAEIALPPVKAPDWEPAYLVETR